MHKPIQEIIDDLNLPQTTKLLGYVVRLPEKEEFLSAYLQDLDSVSAAWTERPYHAILYKTAEEAILVASSFSRPGVMWGFLFDLDADRLLAISLSDFE